MGGEPAEYSPDQILWWLRHWPMLVAATEGGTGSAWRGSGGKRQNLSDIKADLELAADRLPMHWAITARIFKLQQRWRVYLERLEGQPRGGEIDQPVEIAVERMAITLGWTPLEGPKRVA